MHHVREFVLANVVPAVTDHHQGFLVTPTHIKLVQRHFDSVVESSSAFGNAVPECRPQHIDVVRERYDIRKAASSALIEINHKDFVLGIAGLNEGERGRDYVWLFGPHTPAFIHYQTNRYGNIGICKLSNLLWFTVFKNLEVIFRQPRNETTLGVLDTDI